MVVYLGMSLAKLLGVAFWSVERLTDMKLTSGKIYDWIMNVKFTYLFCCVSTIVEFEDDLKTGPSKNKY